MRVFTHDKLLENEFNVKVRSTATFGEVKVVIAKRLSLDPSSLAIFGLFKVCSIPHESGMEICDDDEVLPRNTKEVAFKRLCFDKLKEVATVLQDVKALSLIFFEGVDFIEKGAYSFFNSSGIHLVPIQELSLVQKLRTTYYSINDKLPMVQRVKRMRNYV